MKLEDRLRKKILGLTGALGLYALSLVSCQTRQHEPREYDMIKGVPEISTTLAPRHAHAKSTIILDVDGEKIIAKGSSRAEHINTLDAIVQSAIQSKDTITLKGYFCESTGILNYEIVETPTHIAEFPMGSQKQSIKKKY